MIGIDLYLSVEHTKSTDYNIHYRKLGLAYLSHHVPRTIVVQVDGDDNHSHLAAQG